MSQDQQDEALHYFLEKAQIICPWVWFPTATQHVHETMAQDGGHDWSHLMRVLMAAHQIWQTEGEQGDWQVIAMAVLFHDVVNLPKDHPERKLASTHAARHAVTYIKETCDWRASEVQLTLIEEAIRCHSYSSGFRATAYEAQIVSDADRIDALGILGIARTFAVGGMLQRALAHPGDPLARHRELDEKTWSLDHFFVKLFKLPELMYTKTGRTLADERVKTMQNFVEALEMELLGSNIL